MVAKLKLKSELFRCIAKASPGTDCHHIVSSSDNGEMSLWDTVDGQCIDSKKLNFIHTNIQAYRY